MLLYIFIKIYYIKEYNLKELKIKKFLRSSKMQDCKGVKLFKFYFDKFHTLDIEQSIFDHWGYTIQKCHIKH